MIIGRIVIAIDGVSSCGKSTLAKQLAGALGYIYVDTGAMYRAVTLYMLEKQIDISNHELVKNALEHINIMFQQINGYNTCFLNGKNVEDEIRSLRVSEFVSEVSAIPVVREKLVAIQQEMANQQDLIMDGRDIGTVVFPDAKVKLFITADPKIRAQRRFLELQKKNIPSDIEEIEENLRKRDYIDSTRDHSPLRQAEDAILIDNSFINVQEQFEKALKIIQKKIQL